MVLACGEDAGGAHSGGKRRAGSPLFDRSMEGEKEQQSPRSSSSESMRLVDSASGSESEAEAEAAAEAGTSPLASLVSALSAACGGPESVERVVQYSPQLARLTFEKRLVRLSDVWTVLLDRKRSGLIRDYSFRAMDMEEVLSTTLEMADPAP